MTLIGPNGVAPIPLEDFRKYKVPWSGTALVEDPVDGGMVVSLACGGGTCSIDYAEYVINRPRIRVRFWNLDDIMMYGVGTKAVRTANRGRNASLLPLLPGKYANMAELSIEREGMCIDPCFA